ncbi:type IV pili methyl-accepting chemotaxis transducer N-terminal domain-containing protein [Roseobacter cerasinus]|nr:type IV pili methyl-accepting chemotaxis transducer N-terminal domain-containing protein [Roseobacter cerasinus]
MSVLATAFAMSFLVWPTPGHSGQITAESNARDRMNLAGRERMLTQQLTRNACFVMAGVAPDRFAQRTQENVEDFNRVLVGLRDGDAELGLLPETDPGVLAALDDIEALWEQFRPAAQQISAGDFHTIPMEQLVSLNMATLKQMHETVMAMADIYTNDNMSPDLLKTVAVAGRQRMLSQKVSKEVCFKIIGLDGLGASDLVEATIQDFDDAMARLMTGSEADGILPPPNEATLAQLQVTNATWQEFKQLVADIQGEAEVPAETKIRLSNLSDQVLKEMNAAVQLYVQ